MEPKQTDNARLLDHQDRILRRVIEDSLFFAPWTGEANTRLVNNADGTITREIVSGANTIVEKVTGLTGVSRGDADTAEIPLVKPLEEQPLYGNAYYPGTGESLQYMWRKTFINQIGKVVEMQRSKLDRLRTDKIEQRYKEAAPQLRNYIVKWLNAEALSTIYEGHSMNVTAGLNNSPDGIGATKVLHPNMYTNGVDPDSGGSLDVVGDERKNKLTSDMASSKAVTGTVGTDFYTPNPRALDKVGEKLDELGIQKAATYKGKKYWLVVVDRKVMSELKADSTFRSDLREAFMGEEYNHPLFSQNTWIFDEFMFAIDKKLCRSWNEDTTDFAGDNGYVGNPTWCDSTPVKHRFCPVLGTNALGWANVIPYETRPDTDNFELFEELLAMTIFGWGRGEYVAGTDESAYFAKGNSTATTLGSAKEVKNQTSMLVGFGVTG